jgi:hypothetical protein
MNNNPLIVEQLARQRLADLRAEGMCAQQVARDMPDLHKGLKVPEEGRIFTGLLARAISLAYEWMRRPRSHHPQVR